MSGVVLKLCCSTQSPRGLLKTVCWALPLEFLAYWVCLGPRICKSEKFPGSRDHTLRTTGVADEKMNSGIRHLGLTAPDGCVTG